MSQGKPTPEQLEEWRENAVPAETLTEFYMNLVTFAYKAGCDNTLAELRAGGVELPEKPHRFLCTKCGSHEFVAGTDFGTFANCTCGYMGHLFEPVWKRNEVLDYGGRREAHGEQRGRENLLEELRAGGVKLPEPDGYLCEWKSSDVMFPNKQRYYYGEPGNAASDDWNNYPDLINSERYTTEQMRKYGSDSVAATVPYTLIEAVEALLSNEEHAVSGGMRSYQIGSQTWELWEAVRNALPGAKP